MTKHYKCLLLVILLSLKLFKLEAQCPVSASLNVIQPTCLNLGGFQLVIPTGCPTASNYVLQWGVTSPCNTPTVVTVPGPGTYSIYFNPGCNINYNLNIWHGSITFTNLVSSISSTNVPTNPTNLSFSPFLNNAPLCPNQCNGNVTGSFFGSNAPLSVTLIPTGSGTSTTLTGVPLSTPITFTGLCSGTQTLLIANSIGCTTLTTFNVASVTPISVTSATSSPSCFGGNNGTYSIAPSGGTPNYTVSYNTVPTQSYSTTTNGTVTGINLVAGAYTATITDGNACTFTTSSTITQPTSITIVPTQTNVNCFGSNNGTGSVSVSGGGGTYTYSWTPIAGTAAVNSSLTAGSQTVNITDNNNCLTKYTFTITQPSSITIISTIRNVTCNAQCTGGATVSATGPTAAVNFTWLAGTGTVISTSNSANGLCAGVYTVIAHDVSTPNGCNTTSLVTINQPTTPILINLSTQSITCVSNPCSGSASTAPTGGNGAPFSFTWTPGGMTTASVNGLCAQSYSLSVADASGCVSPTVFTIASPSVIVPAITQTNVTCNGLSNGAINSSPSGGLAPYTFTLTSSTTTLTSAPPFTNLAAGSYSLYIKDNSSATCPQLSVITLTAPNTLSASITKSNVTCPNLTNGFLSSTPIGGTGPSYTHTWTTPSGTFFSSSASNIAPGSFTYSLKDAIGCTYSVVSTITAPAAFTISFNSTPASCFSSTNGVLSANVSGGTPGYSYLWLPNNFTANPNPNLGQGSYTLNITDARNCTTSAVGAVNSPSAIVITSSTSPALCSGSSNGSATVIATGGTGPYVYSFNTSPVTTNTTGVANTFSLGSYVVTITDANSCVQSTVISIGGPSVLSGSITTIKNSCTACTGGATVSPSGGTPAYSFVWTNSLSVTVATLAGATNLCPGPYTVTIVDNNLCSTQRTVSINQVVFSALPGTASVQCFGSCNASVVVSPVGGTPPYSYTWTPTAQNTQTATNLCGNITYTVQVKESSSSGCISTTFVTVSSPASITVNGTTVNPTCFGSTNGAITTTASGGTAPYTYTWSPGGQSTSSLSSQAAGNYTVNVRDVNGCTVTPQSFTLSQTNSISATFVKTLPTNCTSSNGTICAVPSGGSGSGYTFTWSPGLSTLSCINGIGAGNYSITIRDGASCTQTFITSLNSPSGPTLSIVQQSVACFGQSTGGATVTTTGNGPFNYTWSPAVAGNTTIVNGVLSNTYNVTAMDVNSCIVTQSIAITQASAVTINSLVSNSQCGSGSLTGSITVNPTGGTPAFTYSWTGAPTVTTQNVTGLGTGTYVLKLTDAAGCVNNYTFTVSAPPAITITANSTKTVVCNSLTNGSITANASGGTAPLTYTWAPLTPFAGSLTPTVFNLGPGVYSVNAIDAFGCTASVPATWTLSASTLSSSINQQSTTCTNSTNASATITASGGAPTYSFSWSFGTSTTNVISNLGVGNYVGTVVDADGCSSQQSFTVSSASSYSVSLTPTHPKCNGTLTGSITTVPTGGAGTLSYSWSPSGTGQNPTNLGAGTYTLITADQNSCQVIAVTSLTNPPLIQSNLVATNTICNAVCNGSAFVNPVNAVGSVSVTWLPTGPNSNTITGLCATNYTVIVTDANGCTDITPFFISSYSPININASASPPTCGLSDGSITINTSGGTPGYSYTWSPSVSTGTAATTLSAQVYTVYVKDNANCTNTAVIPLSNSNGPVASISATHNVCFGQSVGAASVGVISSGTPPYKTPVWVIPAPSQTAVAISNLSTSPTGYSVQLEDNVGCKSFVGVFITQPSSLTINQSIGLTTCNGVCNGSISLATSGGVGPYSYSWTPTAANSSVLTNLCANDYTVLITHNSGSCTETHVYNIPSQTNLTFTDNIVPSTCFSSCNGVATVSIVNTPGIPSPIAFSWSTGQSGAGPLSSSISGLCRGSYSVTATGANGCFNVHTFTVGSPSQMTVSSSSLQPNCGVCNGSISATTSGGTGSTYGYSWSSGATTSSLANLCAGIYILNVSDAAGCVESKTIILNNSNGISTPTISTQNIPCGATCNGAATITASSPNLPISYNWINPAVSGSVISNLCPGTYFVQLQDAAGCVLTDSASITAASSITIGSFIKPPVCGVLTNGTVNLAVSGGSPTYTFTWLPNGPNSATLTNIGPGSYTITVNDSSPGGCPTTSVINVSNINSPSVSILTSSINCFNTCTGAATAIVTGTAAPFIFNWSGGGNISTVSNLCKGVITLTVTDTNTCSAIESFTIDENSDILLNPPAVTQPNCNQCNGSANINAFGGVAPYTYVWTNGSNGSVVNGLCAGLYQVQITDSKNCQRNQNIIINNSSGITGATITPSNIACGSTCSGAFTVSASSANMPITYNWINPVNSGSIITNLCAGNYFVQMQDASGCILTRSASISAASNISVAPLVVLPACGQSNGIIQLGVSGGTPSYTYNWLPSAPNSATLTNVGPGSYSVTVSDASPGGCQTSTVININNINAPGVAITASDVNCYNQCTGAATAVVTGTTGPFTYNWSVGGNASIATNLCKGVITLTVTDTKTCVAIKAFSINENAPLQINTPLINQPNCNQCNGSTSITAVGGVLPYTYSWTNGSSGSNLSNLCAGLYQVLVTDQKNCQQTQNVVINNSNGITGANFNVSNLACSSTCNGAATVTAVGGSTPIAYSWINPALSSTSNVVSNLCAGNYFVQLTDQQGCLRTASTSITAGSNFSLTASVLSPTCNGTNGQISLTVVGGNAPFTYSWTPSAPATSSISGLSAGTYSVIVTDNNGTGCQKSQSFNLNNLNGPSFSSAQKDVNCFGTCTGSISVTPTGTAGTTFNWSNGSTGQSISGLCKGIVSVTATANGCKTMQSYTISENPKLEFHANVIKLTCANKCDGQIALLPVGGLLTYSFNGSSALNANLSSNLCAGKYTYTVVDQAGCSVADSVRIINPLPISSVLNSTNSSCASVRDASASVLLSGGTPSYSVVWTGPSGFNSSQTSLTNILSGTYTLSVTDNFGCKKDSVLLIKSNIEINANAGLDSTICSQSTVMLSGAKSLNVTRYAWYESPNLSSPIANVVNHPLTQVTKTATYVLVGVSPVPSCSDTDQVVINVFSAPFLDAGPSFTIPVYSSVNIGGAPTSLGPETLTWSPAVSLDNVNSQNPLASNTINVIYTVSMVYGKGCIASDTMRVDVYPEIKVTGGFSPNNDGKNDVWIVDYLDQFPEHEVEIYNRWGDLLFYSKNYNLTPFDGKYKGKNLPVGTYYYVIKLNHPGYPKPYTGPVTIFR